MSDIPTYPTSEPTPESTPSNATPNATSNPTSNATARPLCQHCHRRKITKPRKLCGFCYNDPSIRELYPTNRPFYGFVDSGPLLPPPPRVYPDKTLLPLCPHQVLDGECPICEREARAKLVYEADSVWI